MLTTLCRHQAGAADPRGYSRVGWGIDKRRNQQPYFVDFASFGTDAEVLRLADGPYQQIAAWDAEVPWLLASAHAAVGAKDEALHWFESAIEKGMINYPFLSEHDWHLNSIRGEARFGQAMERAKREWDRLEV